MRILGVSAFYHDSAAALVVDGDIVAAAQEERFSREKHDARLPVNAIDYCLAEGGLTASDLDAVVYYDNPLLTLDRVLTTTAATGERAFEQFAETARRMLGSRVWLADHLRSRVGPLGKTDDLLVVDHHLAHAASAFYPSPFDRAAIVTIDGVGEWATTTIGIGDGTRVDLLREIEYPHSLGMLYSAFTYYCGFKVNSGEYKLMGLAPYGEPRYADTILDTLIELKADGSFRLNTDYFGYLDSAYMTNARFDALFGGPPRAPETRIEQRHMDLAASIQRVLEDAVMRMCRHARDLTGADSLVLAGGVALNCVANGRVAKSGMFEELWIQPAAGDAGGAVGAALAASHMYFGEPRIAREAGQDGQHASLLGPAFSNDEIRDYLDDGTYPYDFYETPDALHERVAELVTDGNVVGYFRGRMEFGPRALGARSIIGDARDPNMQARMNLKIKFRESFRPFAPAVLREEAAAYFDIDQASPYMLLVAPVLAERRTGDGTRGLADNGYDMLAVVSQARSDIPAVTHVDYSARLQTVDAREHPDFHGLLSAIHNRTGCAVAINTSFNVRGEPIVCTPEDAYRCFMRTELDALVLENFVLLKADQPALEEQGDWRSRYALD